MNFHCNVPAIQHISVTERSLKVAFQQKLKCGVFFLCTFKKQKIYSSQPCLFIFLNIKCVYQSVDWLVTKMLMNKTVKKYYISFLFFSKFQDLFNRNLVQTIAFSYIFHKKGYIGHIFWDRPCFTTITVMYFFHVNIVGIPLIIHMQKIKKKATSSIN